MVQCVGYRGLAYRNSRGQWKSILGNKTLPENLIFLPPMQANLPVQPDDLPFPVIVPTTGPVVNGSGGNQTAPPPTPPRSRTN